MTVTTGIAVKNTTTYNMDVFKLTSSKVMVLYRDYLNSGYCTGCVLTISGTSMTRGANIPLNSLTTIWMAGAALSDTEAIVVYLPFENSAYTGVAKILDGE